MKNDIGLDPEVEALLRFIEVPILESYDSSLDRLCTLASSKEAVHAALEEAVMLLVSSHIVGVAGATTEGNVTVEKAVECENKIKERFYARLELVLGRYQKDRLTGKWKGPSFEKPISVVREGGADEK